MRGRNTIRSKSGNIINAWVIYKDIYIVCSVMLTARAFELEK